LNLYFSTVAPSLPPNACSSLLDPVQYRVNLCNDTAAAEYRTDDLNDAIKQADALAKSVASTPGVPTPNDEKVNAFSVPALGEEWG
jgi:hypothetical protein